MPEPGRRVALGIEVDDQDPEAQLGERSTQIHGGRRRLADAPFWLAIASTTGRSIGGSGGIVASGGNAGADSSSDNSTSGGSRWGSFTVASLSVGPAKKTGLAVRRTLGRADLGQELVVGALGFHRGVPRGTGPVRPSIVLPASSRSEGMRCHRGERAPPGANGAHPPGSTGSAIRGVSAKPAVVNRLIRRTRPGAVEPAAGSLLRLGSLLAPTPLLTAPSRGCPADPADAFSLVLPTRASGARDLPPGPWAVGLEATTGGCPMVVDCRPALFRSGPSVHGHRASCPAIPAPRAPARPPRRRGGERGSPASRHPGHRRQAGPPPPGRAACRAASVGSLTARHATDRRKRPADPRPLMAGVANEPGDDQAETQPGEVPIAASDSGRPSGSNGDARGPSR